MQRNTGQMKQGHYVQSAIVQTVNRRTLAIRYSQKVVYAEATGIVILTDQQGHALPSPVQWAMLFFIKDIVDGQNTIINRYGLYLQNIVPQTPGTTNPTAPKPTGEENPGITQSAAIPNQDAQTTESEAPPLPSASSTPATTTTPATKNPTN